MHLKVIVSLCVFAFFNSARGDILNPTSFSVEKSEEIALEKWKMLDKNMRSMLDSALQQLLPVMVRSASGVQLSPECMSSLLRIMIGLRQLKELPLKMIDATAKIPSGIFSGGAGDLGHYDQCLDLVEIDDVTKEKKLQGQYCLAELRPALPPQKGKLRISEDIQLFKNFTTDNYVLQTLLKYAQVLYYGGAIFGVCVPSVCSKNDLQNVIAHVATLTGLHGIIHNCEIKEAPVIDGLQYGLIGIIGLIVLLSVLGTVGTAVQSYCKEDNASDKKKKSILSLFFTSFSFDKNVQQLLKVEASSGQELRCIHGIRFLSMAWVILGHAYAVQAVVSKKNAFMIKTVLNDPSAQPMTGAFLAMEAFFCIGGLVMSYSVLKASDSQKKFIKYLPLILFRRLSRIWPAMLLVIAVQFLLPLMDSGPLWKAAFLPMDNVCRHTWFLNILFVSNFFRETLQCLPHLWYLSMDMQFFIVAIILMFIFYWKQKWNFAMTTGLILCSVVITSAITYWRNFFPILAIYTTDFEEVKDQGTWIYLNPITHLASYCIGLTTGIIIANNKKVKLHPLLVAAGWCASTALALTMVYYPVKWVRGEPYNTAELLLFSGLYRPVFAICVAWIVFACVNGYGGVVNRILSWTGFVPLSRLTFLAYLVHPLVMMYWILRSRDTFYTEHHLGVSLFITYLVASYAFAFVINSVFDGPMNNLTKILVGQFTKGREKEQLKTSEAKTAFGNSKLNHEAVNEMMEGSYVKRL